MRKVSQYSRKFANFLTKSRQNPNYFLRYMGILFMNKTEFRKFHAAVPLKYCERFLTSECNNRNKNIYIYNYIRTSAFFRFQLWYFSVCSLQSPFTDGPYCTEELPFQHCTVYLRTRLNPR